uniref:Uncharacterized protein n=1 Tax=Amphilophus citrinellus TaxID=61819 RepID=A0A3Q0SFI1_AMPCI
MTLLSAASKRMWTGPGPQWAIGGDTVTVSRGSEARGRRRVTGGTVKTKPDSVRFQKDFQNCKSRFWVMRSNSAPRNSPKPDCCLPNVSPYETILMTTVCRNGRMEGEYCETK